MGYVIQLTNGNLWKNLGAESAAIFSTLENARKTVAGFSGRGVLANPTILKLASGPIEGQRQVGGYWVREV